MNKREIKNKIKNTRLYMKTIHRIKHSRWYKKIIVNKRIKIAIIAFLIVFVIVIALLIYKDQKAQSIYDVNTSSGTSNGDVYSLTYDGVSYDYNTQVTSVLLIGVDSRGDIEAESNYGESARADNIMLIVFDKGNKEVKVLPVSRDTITEVKQFTAGGYEAGSTTTHIGFAFQFGNGGRPSCTNTCDAVSTLLYGIPVRHYVATNIDSLGYANELVGGVTVTVPNNDLAGRYPDMVKGAKVLLTEDNIEAFLRSRNTNVDGSNNGRMARQQAFMEAFIKKVRSMSKSEYDEMWDKLSADDSNILTNISKSYYLKLLKSMKDYTYEPEEDNLKIVGTDDMEDGYDVFYPDQDLLKKQVIDIFYNN